MKISITHALGWTIFIAGIPTSLAPQGLEMVQSFGNALIVAGAIIIGACAIARSVSDNRLG